MNKLDKMNKGRIIYWLGVLFLIFTLLKYLYVPTVFPPVYFTFEIMGIIVVLVLLYYTKSFTILKADCRDKELEKQNALLTDEASQLKTRIKELETYDNELRSFVSIKERMVSELVEMLNSNSQEKLAKNMFSMIKSHFELVGGIVYHKNTNDEAYQSIVKYGFDDEILVAPVIVGEGLHGQVIDDNRAKEVDDVPEDYLEVTSGTGSAQPAYIYFLPLVDVAGNNLLIEIASFKKLGMDIIWNEFLDSLNGQKFN